jgi:hypothetical protein
MDASCPEVLFWWSSRRIRRTSSEKSENRSDISSGPTVSLESASCLHPTDAVVTVTTTNESVKATERADDVNDDDNLDNFFAS